MRLFIIISSVLCRQLIDKFAHLSTSNQLRQLSNLSNNLSITGPILSEFLIPRVSGTPGNKKVQKYIINTFEKLGWAVEQDTFRQDTPFGNIEFNNIVVTHNPAARHRLVLACHFDSKHFDDFEFIGATGTCI